jgi:hypothetical protein
MHLKVSPCMVPPRKTLAGTKCLLFCILFHLVTLTDDPDNINLSSPYHYPSRKNSTLLSGSHWRPKKRIIAHFGPLGFRPGLPVKRGSFIPLTNTVRTTVRSPEESMFFFCFHLQPQLHTEHRMSRAAPYHDVLRAGVLRPL